MLKTRVRELMTPDVATVRRDQDLRDLQRILVRQGVHGVPVVDEQRRIVGVVSQSDLLAWRFETSDPGGAQSAPGADRDARGTTVGELMSPVVHCIGPEAGLDEAAGRMVREHVHRLIVVADDFTVVGILSATDLLRAVPGADRFLGTNH